MHEFDALCEHYPLPSCQLSSDYQKSPAALLIRDPKGVTFVPLSDYQKSPLALLIRARKA
jgi:hypothetical protein